MYRERARIIQLMKESCHWCSAPPQRVPRPGLCLGASIVYHIEISIQTGPLGHHPSRGIIIALYRPSHGIVIVRHYPSHGIIIARYNPSRGIIIKKKQAS
jgi:hypothetical protein